MKRSTLRERAIDCFEAALRLTAEHPRLAALDRQLRINRERLDLPMRVAVVGVIKAGKSTMMNALLREEIVPTGAIEATFNVTWIRFGEEPSLTVHYKDGRPPELRASGELQELTLRSKENADKLLSIRYIELQHPSQILRTFDLIDTPGLLSFYQDDSDNTREFLKLHGGELQSVTQEQAANADAVLYLFSQSIGASDAEIVERLHGPGVGRATPINAIGVLTKVDAYWSDEIATPLETAHRIAQRLAQHPRARHLFYDIRPVCGLLAVGAQTLTDRDFETLRELATVTPAQFEHVIQDAERFSEREYLGVPVPATRRKQLLSRLDRYGVWLACRILREGEVATREQLAERLLAASGVPALRDLIVSHFGNRAFLIKLMTSLEQSFAACFEARKNASAGEAEAIKAVAGALEKLKLEEHAIRELDVLRAFYQARESFSFRPEEIKQILEVTGEFGCATWARLGLPENTGEDAMLSVARERAREWQLRAMDYVMSDRATISAAHTVVRSYHRILEELQPRMKTHNTPLA